MDWKRAKNILIVMFLIINIFLTYQLFSINRSQYVYIDKQELQEVIKYLDKKNVKVLADIPERVYISPAIRVKYHQFDEQKLKAMFFKSGDLKQKDLTEEYVLSNNDIEIKVKQDIFLTYSNKSISINQDSVDEDKCLNNAYDFVNKLRLDAKGRYVKLKDVQKGYVRLVLGQQYNSIPVESSQIEVIATEAGVTQARVSWFESIRPEKKDNIITPVMALLKAYENRGAKEDAAVIKQIRQGYYFNPNTVNGAEAPTIFEGTVSPMWVIVSDTAEIYINAYNEKKEIIR